MKNKKIYLIIMNAILVLMLFLSFSACSNNIKWTIGESEEIPHDINVEYGVICTIPNLNLKYKKNQIDLLIKLFNSKGLEEKINNNKFRANDLNGYKIVYTSQNDKVKQTKEIFVTVKDTTAPKINIVNAENGVSTIINRPFNIPNYSINEVSDQTLRASIEVEGPNKEIIEVINNQFTPNILGEYFITYTATDSSGNIAKKILPVYSKKGVVLNNFETIERNKGVIKLGRAAWSKELISETESFCQGVKVSMNKDDSTWSYLTVGLFTDDKPMEWKQIKKLGSIEISVYSSYDAIFMLAGQNSPVHMKIGMNIIIFSHKDLMAAYEYSENQYNEADGSFSITIRNSPQNEYFIFSQVIGTYPDEYEAPKCKIDIESTNGFVVLLNSEYKIPTANIKMLADGSTVEYAVKVTDPEGNEVEVINNKFTPIKKGSYKLLYYAKEIGIENNSEELIVECVNGEILCSFSNKNGEDLISLGRAAWTRGYTTENAQSEDGANILNTNGDKSAWSGLKVLLKSNGSPILWKDLTKFEYLQMYIYSSYITIINIGSKGYQIKEGINCLTVPLEEIKIAYQETKNNPVKQFDETTGAFYLGIRYTYEAENDIIVFDNLYGVYSSQYESPKTEISINSKEGSVAIINSEYFIPTANIKMLADGSTVEYAVKVTDPEGNEVEVINNKFTPIKKGSYKLLYYAKEIGIENNSEELIVECVNGEILCSFSNKNGEDLISLGRATWTRGYTTENAQSEDGANILNTNGDKSAWNGLKVLLKSNGSPILWKDLTKFEYLQMYIYSSYDTSIFIGSKEHKINAGINILDTLMSDIISQYEKDGSKLYDETTGALNVGIKNTREAENDIIVFDNLYGVYSNS